MYGDYLPPRFRRFFNAVAVVSTVLGAALVVYWIFEWANPKPDQYRQGIPGSLALAAFLTLFPASSLARSIILRRIMVLSACTLLLVSFLLIRD